MWLDGCWNREAGRFLQIQPRSHMSHLDTVHLGMSHFHMLSQKTFPSVSREYNQTKGHSHGGHSNYNLCSCLVCFCRGEDHEDERNEGVTTDGKHSSTVRIFVHVCCQSGRVFYQTEQTESFCNGFLKVVCDDFQTRKLKLKKIFYWNGQRIWHLELYKSLQLTLRFNVFLCQLNDKTIEKGI